MKNEENPGNAGMQIDANHVRVSTFIPSFLLRMNPMGNGKTDRFFGGRIETGKASITHQKIDIIAQFGSVRP